MLMHPCVYEQIKTEHIATRCIFRIIEHLHVRTFMPWMPFARAQAFAFVSYDDMLSSSFTIKRANVTLPMLRFTER